MKKLLAVAFACATAVGCAQNHPAPVVGVKTPVEVAESEPRSYVGTVKASERAAVTAQISGRIWKQNFREGGRAEEWL